jgi:cytochrome c2
MTMQVGRTRLFWIAAAVIAAVLLFTIYLRVSPVSNTRRALYIVGNPEKGAELFYGSKQCGICHSINGAGGRIAPELSGTKPARPAMGWMISVLWNHGPGMWRRIRQSSKAYPELNPQEMADILAFLYQSTSVDQPGDRAAGKAVFHDKGCDRCHSVAGAGGKAAPELSAIAVAGDPNAWTTAMLNHAGSMVGPISSTIGQWPDLSGNQMRDLIAYVTTGTAVAKSADRKGADPQRGWVVFQSRCMPCHSVGGQGGNLGPELGPDQDIPLTTAGFASVMWNHAPTMLKEAKDKGIPPSQLQGKDMADLLAFLVSLRYCEPSGSALVGQRVFAERGCAACHGATGEGSKMGPPLRRQTEAYTTVSFTTALWQHGPEMLDRVQERGMSWPELKPTDIGNLVSFLNVPPASK